MTARPPPARARVVRIGPAVGRGAVAVRCSCPPSAPSSWCCSSAVSLGRGDFPIGLADVLRALAGVGDPGQQFVVRELRAPRIVVGLLVGAALGVAGALFQTSARNPLASPDVLGITQGASAGAVAAIVLGRRRRSGVPAGRAGRRAAHRRPPVRADLAGRGRRLPPGAGRHRAVGGGLGAGRLAAHPRRHPRRRVGLRLDHRLAQRPHLGARRPAGGRPGRAAAARAGRRPGPRRAPARRRHRPRARGAPGHRAGGRGAGRGRLRRGRRRRGRADRVRRARRPAAGAAADRRLPAAGAGLGRRSARCSSSAPTSSPAPCCPRCCPSAS